MLFIIFIFSPQVFCLSKLYTNDCLNDYKEYTVSAICDGDTILIGPGKCEHGFSQNKIRLLGIDAFETGQKPLGEASKKFLSNLLLNKKVCVELDTQEKDKYDRTLGYVFLIKPKNVIASTFATLSVNSAKQSNKSNMKSKIASSPPRRVLAMTKGTNPFVNEELLKEGLAILYSFPPNTKYIKRLKKAQIFARENKLGIWKDNDYIKETPYQFRRRKKS